MYATAKEYLRLQQPPRAPVEKFESRPSVEHKPVDHKPVIDLKWVNEIVDTSDPKVWGPAFWFSLHTTAAHYPINPSNIVKERMKHRILAIPYEISCAVCWPHASAFIESHKEMLDDIVSTREKLFNFYVDFHNKVNARYGKRQWTYDEAYKAYSGKAKVQRLL